jgi:hypothetical protein
LGARLIVTRTIGAAVSGRRFSIRIVDTTSGCEGGKTIQSVGRHHGQRERDPAADPLAGPGYRWHPTFNERLFRGWPSFRRGTGTCPSHYRSGQYQEMTQ